MYVVKLFKKFVAAAPEPNSESEVLRGLGRTSPQRLNAGGQACASGVERLCEVLESFESFDDLRREGLEVLEDTLWERRD